MESREVGGPSLERGVVFQSHGLMPWLTVRKNIAFAVVSRWADWTSAQVNAHVEKFVAMVGLTPAIDKKPSQLSGGMKQRVGIVRALATSPQVMLMDEPFGALDSQTRTVMQEILTNMWQQLQLSVLFITHDIEEAIFLSEKVYVMTARPGRIKAEIPIPLPRPRTPEMTASPTFQALVRQLKALIREESLAAMGGELHSGGLQGMDHQFSHDGMNALI
jgi:NitT/TauT family transport system ATP-binding protein